MFLTKKRGGLAAAALVAAFGLAAPASAVTLADLGDPITTTVPDGQSVSTGWVFAGTFGGNDCAGAWRPKGLRDCEFEDSPIIAKIDYNDDGSVKKTEVNTGEFPGFDLGWITVNNSGGSSGTWEYDPGPDGPGITAFVAKGGNYFNLFYTVDFEPFFGGSAVNWFTPKQCGGGPNGSNSPNFCGLSHLSFYDSEGGTPEDPAARGGLADAGRNRRPRGRRPAAQGRLTRIPASPRGGPGKLPQGKKNRRERTRHATPTGGP
jgi:hypothetical protein